MAKVTSLFSALLLTAVLTAGCDKVQTPGFGAAPTTMPAGIPAAAVDPNVAVITATLPSGDAACDLVRVEKSSPREVLSGKTFDYKLTVTNIGRKALEDVAVMDTLPAGLKVVGSSPQARSSGETLKWTVDRLDVNATRTFVVRVTAGPAGALRSCVSVTWKVSEVCLATQVVQPALKVEMLAAEKASACDPLTYRIVVTNSGSGKLANVTVTAALGEGLATLEGKKDAKFNADMLAGGESREFSVQAKAARSGKYTSKATATAEGGLTASAEAATTLGKPALLVTKTGPSNVTLVKGAVTVPFEITVKNSGDAEAKEVVLTDVIPAGATVAASDPNAAVAGGKATWTLGTLTAGQSRSVKISLSVPRASTIRNAATAKSTCAEGSAEALTKVSGIPAVSLACVDAEDPVAVGGECTYEITLTNQGNTEDTGLVVVATLSPDQEFVSAKGPTKYAVKDKEVTFEPLAALAAKANESYKVVARCTKVGDLRFRVQLKSDWLKEPVIKTESTNVYAK